MAKTERYYTTIDGVWCECETVMEDGIMKIIKSTPMTPEKEYNDFMAFPSNIKEIIFNGYLTNYCIQGTNLPAYIVRICKENGIDFRALKWEYRKNKTIRRFKFK